MFEESRVNMDEIDGLTGRIIFSQLINVVQLKPCDLIMFVHLADVLL